ncbi:MAG: amylo-alpha-1,6-glucosidase [Bacteroidales bacterium]
MKDASLKKDDLLYFEFSLNREILHTNMSNTYACTSLVGCNTRKYHGLSIAPLQKIDNENYILLSYLDETVIANEDEFHLAIHRHQGGIFYPKEYKYLESYSLKDPHLTTYHIGDIVLIKQIQIQERRERILIKYNYENSDEFTLSSPNADNTTNHINNNAYITIKLQLNPLLSFRQIHQLSKYNHNADNSYTKIENGIAYKLYPNYTPLYPQFSKKVYYQHKPNWYCNLEYIKKRKRDYNYIEDLLIPGSFNLEMNQGESVYLVCGIKEDNHFLLSIDFKKEVSIRFSINTMTDVLKRVVRIFFCHKITNMVIVDGFPGFRRRVRGTFISLFGLCCTLYNINLLLNAIDSIIKDFKDGVSPNRDYSNQIVYNSVNVPLWFFWCLQQYTVFTKEQKTICRKYSKFIKSIISTFEKGGSNIRMDSNYLLFEGQEGKVLIWMDVIIDDNPVTQRKGYTVEINALWHNATIFTKELAEQFCDNTFSTHCNDFARNFPSNLKKTLCDKQKVYLANCVHNNNKNFPVRSNMIFAVSLKYSPLSLKIRQVIVERVRQELLTPYGLFYLSPKDLNYCGHYCDNLAQQDRVYHNGTVWSWLWRACSEDYLRVYGSAGINHIMVLCNGFENTLINYRIGSIAEVYDTKPPFNARGNISKA